MSKKKLVQFEASERVVELLHRLQEETKADDLAEVLQDALSDYGCRYKEC